MPISTPPSPEEMELIQQIIYRHSISNAQFNGLVYAFFDRLPVELTPIIKNDEEIRTSLKDGAIEDKVLMTVSSKEKNNDLIFHPDLVMPPGAGGDGESNSLSSYSVGLLVGLATIFPGCTFNFYKATKYIGGGMKNTAVFSIKLGSHDVYFGDLSEAHP